MSPARRIETPPWATQDVPDAEQIVDFGGDTAYSADIPQTPAQEIARLLSEGRANEVTDELYAQADPQELHQLYTSGATGVDMPMDTPSRMARADEMGFDTGTPLYHGTDADFQAFSTENQRFALAGPGVYSSSAPSIASDYANREGGRVIPKIVRGEYKNTTMPEVTRRGDEIAPPNTGYSGSVDAYVDEATKDGFSGLNVSVSDGSSVVTTFDPSNIRSKFARFDPRLSNLRNLSAGVAGAGAVGLAAQSRQPEERRELPPLAPELAFMKDIYR
jgi:hypothetical protein